VDGNTPNGHALAASRSSTVADRFGGDGAPSSPADFGAGESLSVLKRSTQRFLDDNCMGLAAQVAYASLLAFFPAVVALVGLLDLVNAYGTLESFLHPVAPHAVLSLIQTFRTDSGGGGSVVALGVGTVGAIWAASSAIGSIMFAVNNAYECKETRPFWKKKLIAIVLVLVMTAVLVGMTLLIVFGGTLGAAIADKLSFGNAFKLAWNIARWPIAFFVVVLLFGIIYYLGPNREPRNWKWISPGSVLGAILWLALSGLFALYTSFSNSYTKTYGTLAAGIVLLLWLNYSAWAILFGAELNAELERRARERRRLTSARR